jgi:N-acylneuraminate cytidylyltransferase
LVQPPIGNVAAVIAARGGSKGIPGKNLLDFCGRPLLAWSVEQAVRAEGIASVWVTSDNEAILEVAAEVGAQPILRPPSLAGDDSSSEAAWLHALDEIESLIDAVDVLCAMQATSPLREPADLDRGLRDFAEQRCDALFSAAALDDFLVWEQPAQGALRAVNYDPLHRGRRQDRSRQYVENGSFYLVRPGLLRETGNRLGGRVGISLMDFWKSFEIDTPEDVEMCEALMRHYLLEDPA